ncbi:MAG: cupin domain-containing protein [Streptomycetaceae bacterium]|nr:cupin domain-containing protein [Streptomycetaceae bacterium]
MATPVVAQRDDSKAYWMLNGLYEVRVSGDETDGAMTVMEMTLPAGMGPPPHIHPGAETVYVAEGSIKYHIDGKTFDGNPGSVFHIPAGTVENFEPTSTVRLVVTYTPGGIDKFFAEAGEPAQSRTVPPPSDTPPDFERFKAIGARHGIEMLPFPGGS